MIEPGRSRAGCPTYCMHAFFAQLDILICNHIRLQKQNFCTHILAMHSFRLRSRQSLSVWSWSPLESRSKTVLFIVCFSKSKLIFKVIIEIFDIAFAYMPWGRKFLHELWSVSVWKVENSPKYEESNLSNRQYCRLFSNMSLTSNLLSWVVLELG